MKSLNDLQVSGESNKITRLEKEKPESLNSGLLDDSLVSTSVGTGVSPIIAMKSNSYNMESL